MWYCDTDELPAIRSQSVIMRHIDDKVVDLALKLEPKIKAMTDEGEITLRVKHGWVASIGIFVVELFTKLKTVD